METLETVNQEIKRLKLICWTGYDTYGQISQSQHEYYTNQIATLEKYRDSLKFQGVKPMNETPFRQFIFLHSGEVKILVNVNTVCEFEGSCNPEDPEFPTLVVWNNGERVKVRETVEQIHGLIHGR